MAARAARAYQAARLRRTSHAYGVVGKGGAAELCCGRAAAPGVNQKLQVLRAAWLPLGDRLLRRLLALLGGLVTRVQLHRSAWPHVGRALRGALASGGGWDCRAWGWGRSATGRQKCRARCSSCRHSRAVPGECVSLRALALTSHLGLNKRLSRLLLRSRRSRRQHLHSRARDAARLARLRRQRRQKAGARRSQAQHSHHRHEHQWHLFRGVLSRGHRGHRARQLIRRTKQDEYDGVPEAKT